MKFSLTRGPPMKKLPQPVASGAMMPSSPRAHANVAHPFGQAHRLRAVVDENGTGGGHGLPLVARISQKYVAPAGPLQLRCSGQVRYSALIFT